MPYKVKFRSLSECKHIVKETLTIFLVYCNIIKSRQIS